jgi:hypothetical protein
MKKALALILCVVACPLYAAEMYKCVQNGRLTISSEPCPTGAKSTVITPDAAPDTPVISSDEELARLKQKLEVLERERLQRNAARAAAEAERQKQEAQAAKDSEESAEPVNAHGRLNAARKRREEAAKNNSGGNTGGNAGGNSGSGSNAGGSSSGRLGGGGIK